MAKWIKLWHCSQSLIHLAMSGTQVGIEEPLYKQDAVINGWIFQRLFL